MTAVRFLRNHDRYMRGEIAGFRLAEAERLVRRKVARLHKPAAEVASPAANPPELSAQDVSGKLANADYPDAVEIPNAWRDLSWPARRSLASRLTNAPIVSGEDAEQAIRAELARRGR